MMGLNAYVSKETSNCTPLIQLADLELVYQSGSQKRKVLEQISLGIQTGEFVCVLGPSGCGKTSLLQIIAGYEQATSGTVKIHGEAHKGPNADIGVVFQQANLFPWLTIEKNIAFGLKMKGLPRIYRKRITAELLEMVDLTAAAKLLPHQLSGGMKQRAAIARSLATEPKLILMDEPFGALDSITRQNLQEQLRNLWKKTSKTIFFITHDVDEAIFLGSRILVLNGTPGNVVLDQHNPLAGKITNADTCRELKGYHELRAKFMQALKEKN